MSDPDFTHLDARGSAHMVDVGDKPVTQRRAVARCRVTMLPETARAIEAQRLKKGDVLSVARVAGIMAAKRTSEAIPLCHPLAITKVTVDLNVRDDHVEIEASVDCVERTGVEMEALHACSVAALTVYDMCKAIDKAMTITDLAVWEKMGGRSGTFRRAG